MLRQDENEEARQRIKAFAQHCRAPSAPPAATDLSEGPDAKGTMPGPWGSGRVAAAKAAIMDQALQASLSADTHASRTACWHPGCRDILTSKQSCASSKGIIYHLHTLQRALLACRSMRVVRITCWQSLLGAERQGSLLNYLGLRRCQQQAQQAEHGRHLAA